ncbi:MAG: hypothetical protein AAB817_02970, partial [Patescibacteria group bacterium]
MGQALSFDGVDDYVGVGNVGTGIKTVEFWINHSTPTAGDEILELNATSTITIAATTGNITAGAGFTTPTIYVDGSSASVALTTGWHHVAVVDGSAGGISASAVNLGKVGAAYMAGKLDEAAVWNTALSAATIWNHAHVTKDQAQTVKPTAPNAALITVNQIASPGIDTVAGIAGAVDLGGAVTVKVYKEAALATLLGSATAAADGSFAAINIGANQATN